MYTFTTRLGGFIAIVIINFVMMICLMFSSSAHACAEDDTNGLFIELKNGDFLQVSVFDIDKGYLAFILTEESMEEDPKWRTSPIETSKLYYSDSKGKLYRFHINPDKMKVRTDHGDEFNMPIRIQIKLDE